LRIPSLTAGLLFALVLGSALFLPGCGSGDQDRADGGSKSSSDDKWRPHEPSFPGETRDFGVARRSDMRGGGPANDYQDRAPYSSPYSGVYPPRDAERTRDGYAPPEVPFWQRSSDGGIISSAPLRDQSQAYGGGYSSRPDPYGGGYRPYAPPGAGPMPPQQYSFRPLTDREKEHMQRQSAVSGYPSYGSRYDPYGTPVPYQAAPPYPGPAYPELDRDGYSYWAPAPRSEDDSMSPPQSWGQRQERADQWGTTPSYPYSRPPLQRWPPAERMLPNLDEGADRSFAAN
jgi:hypothetical protein